MLAQLRRVKLATFYSLQGPPRGFSDQQSFRDDCSTNSYTLGAEKLTTAHRNVRQDKTRQASNIQIIQKYYCSIEISIIQTIITWLLTSNPVSAFHPTWDICLLTHSTVTGVSHTWNSKHGVLEGSKTNIRSQTMQHALCLSLSMFWLIFYFV